jgi:hypothetical protein
MRLGGAWLMLTSPRAGRSNPAQTWSVDTIPSPNSLALTVIIDDVDAHVEKAKAAGVKISKDSTRPVTANVNTAPRTSKGATGFSREPLGT